MTEIKGLPEERVYFLPSVNEPDRLHLWIRPEDFESMIQNRQIKEDVAKDHPNGLEVLVSEEWFAEYGLDLGVHPETIRQVYLHLLEQDELEDRMVPADELEAMAREVEVAAQGAPEGAEPKRFFKTRRGVRSPGQPPPSRMRSAKTSDGENLVSVLSDLM